ncbi:phage replisome organizer protein [Lactococcus formosensis]|uniref:phage replisome organizer protein n=1 Tax=Lactococcus formosensis TaxID=1281486 RepID=UPI00311B322A
MEIELEKELKIDIDIEKEKKGYSEDNDNLFQEYIDLFIDFATKNKNKRAMALQTFLNLSQIEKNQIVTGAKNYIEFYKADRPDDTSGQYSVNAYDFLDNAVFKEYQEKPKVAINAYTSDGTNDGWTKNKAWANK